MLFLVLQVERFGKTVNAYIYINTACFFQSVSLCEFWYMLAWCVYIYIYTCIYICTSWVIGKSGCWFGNPEILRLKGSAIGKFSNFPTRNHQGLRGTMPRCPWKRRVQGALAGGAYFGMVKLLSGKARAEVSPVIYLKLLETKPGRTSTVPHTLRYETVVNPLTGTLHANAQSDHASYASMTATAAPKCIQCRMTSHMMNSSLAT